MYHDYGRKVALDRTDELLRYVHPRNGHHKIMAVIEGYLDESGIHDGARVCVVAGYWGGRGQWKKLNSAWSEVLDDFEVPYFHSKEFWKDLRDEKSPYYKWTENDNREFLQALANAILNQRIYPVASAIKVSDFFAYNENQRKFLTGGALQNGKFVTTGCPNKPYFMPFFLCVDSIAGYAPQGGLAHFFCGLDRKFGGYAAELLRQSKEHPETRHREKMGDLHLPEASKTPHLQAADLLAYLSYQYGLARVENENARPGELLHTCLSQIKDWQEDNAWINNESLEGAYGQVLASLA